MVQIFMDQPLSFHVYIQGLKLDSFMFYFMFGGAIKWNLTLWFCCIMVHPNMFGYVIFNVKYYILSQKFYKKIGCIFLSFSVTHVLRNGIPQWWWFDVSHSTVWKIRFRTGKVLLCRNHVGIKILTQKRNCLQVIIDISGFFLFSGK